LGVSRNSRVCGRLVVDVIACRAFAVVVDVAGRWVRLVVAEGDVVDVVEGALLVVDGTTDDDVVCASPWAYAGAGRWRASRPTAATTTAAGRRPPESDEVRRTTRRVVLVALR
jgi:hypothetical protein